MIELRNVDFSYGEKPILRDVSFRIADGEAAVIMGPSGSGKSTTLRLILGLECPSRGEVNVDSKNICAMKEKDKRELRKSIGMVFQDGALFDSLTVGENVGYYLFEHTKLKHHEIEDRVRQMLGFVGLDADEVIDNLPEQLSGGMQRRVAIGRALLSTNPTIMLYDEPTTGLDPVAKEKVRTLIKMLHSEQNISSIVVTHHIADAIDMGKRFVVIVDGEVAFDGDLMGLSRSRDPRVLDFLAPFRASITDTALQGFITGGDNASISTIRKTKRSIRYETIDKSKLGQPQGRHPVSDRNRDRHMGVTFRRRHIDSGIKKGVHLLLPECQRTDLRVAGVDGRG